MSWNEIRKRKAGYVLPFKEKMKEFIEVLDNLSGLSVEEKARISDRVVRIATKKIEQAKKDGILKDIWVNMI